MISKELIILDSSLSTKEEVINHLASIAAKSGYLKDIDQYLSAVYKRERECCTALGYNVGIPHGKSDAVKNTFVACLRTINPIKWGDDNNIVNLVFLLGIPADKKETVHLKILAQISRKILDDNFRYQLLKGDLDKVYSVLNAIEKNI